MRHSLLYDRKERAPHTMAADGTPAQLCVYPIAACSVSQTPKGHSRCHIATATKTRANPDADSHARVWSPAAIKPPKCNNCCLVPRPATRTLHLIWCFSPQERLPCIDMLELCVGKITSVQKHPNAETLYLEEIDVGEEKPRQVGVQGGGGGFMP